LPASPADLQLPVRPVGCIIFCMRPLAPPPIVRLGVLVPLLILAGCYTMGESSGGGQTQFERPRELDPADIALPDGYRIRPLARGLTFPTGVGFDDQGGVYVVEAGYSYGEEFTTPRLLRIEANGQITIIATGSPDFAPWNGIAFRDGAFYVAEGGVLKGGRISRISIDGRITPLIVDLPSMGDHHVNGPAFGPDGMLYFAIGTATNSGIVGPDNVDFGWLRRYPRFHDIPGGDITLAGVNYRSLDPLTQSPSDTAVTGAFLPFGVPSVEGQVVRGQVISSGSIIRISPDGQGLPQLVGWGFRNPYGLAFRDGALYVTDNSFDVRGSRPVWGAGDLLWRVQAGRWHGWPDFHSGTPVDLDDRYKAPGWATPRRVLAQVPNDPPQAAATFAVHASANGLDFSRSGSFGFVGEAFVAQFGDMAPASGRVVAPVGYKVVRVDPETGVIEDFAVNRGRTNGPASKLNSGGLERPVDARFNPAGDALYIVDFGVMTMTNGTPRPRPGTGVLWRITREVER
jgi:glucose/arabinose dehydrogenase